MGITGHSEGVKRPKRYADHPASFSDEVKNSWNVTSISHMFSLRGACMTIFPSLFIYIRFGIV
jgi:hypothetical protein